MVRSLSKTETEAVSRAISNAGVTITGYSVTTDTDGQETFYIGLDPERLVSSNMRKQLKEKLKTDKIVVNGKSL